MGFSFRNANIFFLTVKGRGRTRPTKVDISATSNRKVRLRRYVVAVSVGADVESGIRDARGGDKKRHE